MIVIKYLGILVYRMFFEGVWITDDVFALFGFSLIWNEVVGIRN